MQSFHGTTIVSVRRGERVVIGGDGQVSVGNTIMKGNARKVRRLYKDKVIAGFAGGTADALTLFERFEGKLEKHQGHLLRSAVGERTRSSSRDPSVSRDLTWPVFPGESNKRKVQGNRISNLGQEFGEEVVVPALTFELEAV